MSKENASFDESDDGKERPGLGKPTFSVKIFSHGLWAAPDFVTALLAASRQALVSLFLLSSIETEVVQGHWSTCLKTSMQPNSIRQRQRSYSGNEGQRKEQNGVNQYYVMGYILTRDNTQDTSPRNPRGVDSTLRTAQIELLLEEIKEAYHVLALINDGKGDEFAQLNLRKGGNIGSSSMGLTGISWDRWKGSIFLDKVTAMGHSFGGATTVQLCRDQSLTWLGRGVILDAWGQGTPPRGDDPNNIVPKPIMVISSEAFVHWKDNFESGGP